MAAQDEMRREAGAMRDEARAMWNDASDLARSAAGQQQQAAAQGLGNFAGALREAARKTDDGSGATSRVAETVADSLDRLSTSLKGRDLGSLLRDVEDFARSQPLVFFSAAVATGFIAMRFLKSSEPSTRGSDAFGSMGESDAGPYRGSVRSSDSMRDLGPMQGRDSVMKSRESMEHGAAPQGREPMHAQDPSRSVDGTPSSRTVLPGDTARSNPPPNVWPEANPAEEDAPLAGAQPRSNT